MTTAEAALPAAPSPAQMDRLSGVLAPLARVTRPHVEGAETLPRRGALYVGNHTLFAFLDLPFMMTELWRRRGVVLRGIGDHGHYAIPVWRDLLELCGMVRGTRENVRALMAAGEDVLIFPGGADEVFKGRGLKYELLWKERLGFAKLAIEFGYPVVPFAAVGAEEMYDVVADKQTPGLAQVSTLMKRLVGVPLPPIPLGVGILPRPERLYFRFAKPVDAGRYDGEVTDDDARELRDEVRTAVLDGIERLHSFRGQDPDRHLARRLRGVIESLPQLAVADPDAHFVTRAFEAWNTQGPEGAAAWFSRWAELIDPPDWPGASTWRGRDATLRRLEQVTQQLGGAHVRVGSATSLDDERVDVHFDICADARNSAPIVGRFSAEITLEQDQIVRMQVSTNPSATA